MHRIFQPVWGNVWGHFCDRHQNSCVSRGAYERLPAIYRIVGNFLSDHLANDYGQANVALNRRPHQCRPAIFACIFRTVALDTRNTPTVIALSLDVYNHIPSIYLMCVLSCWSIGEVPLLWFSLHMYASSTDAGTEIQFLHENVVFYIPVPVELDWADLNMFLTQLCLHRIYAIVMLHVYVQLSLFVSGALTLGVLGGRREEALDVLEGRDITLKCHLSNPRLIANNGLYWMRQNPGKVHNVAIGEKVYDANYR